MAVFKSKLTRKRRITIPLEVRRRLGVRQGDELEFETGGPEVLIRPVRENIESFSNWRGIATFPGGMKEVNAWIREMRGDSGLYRGRAR
ncbi:MAG TPA: AbrB/MazE/SpoVT family DNA-binding domain-containing protein [Bryobacteraceae bacterium]|jgi:AbrB family looped-hinge helix DNA binding protein|nr:AbrB/MazE/SpoVT family DNA-binding domain-containing protein [Bryobacteraceae bacterium]